VSGPATIRTPDEQFRDLPDFPFAPHYLDFEGARMHYLDEGPRGGEVLLCLHGEPTWCFLYRRMIPPLAAAGYRVIAPDWIGFGRSDKYLRLGDYSYERHVRSLENLVAALDLRAVTPIVQDWGGLIGLPWAAEHPDRVARLVILNTALPTGERSPGLGFRAWRAFARLTPVFSAGWIVKVALRRPVDPAVLRAYDAPFPDRRYKAGARAFPRLVPTEPEAPFAARNRAARDVFDRWEKPTLLRFGREDPILGAAGPGFLTRVKALRGQAMGWIERAGHFVQEDASEELVAAILPFLAAHRVADAEARPRPPADLAP
jgi:haloalkane dehalogenase